MKDIFKQLMHDNCSVGGLFCHCCNMWKGKDKKRLNRIVRSMLKQKDLKENKQTEIDYELEKS